MKIKMNAMHYQQVPPNYWTNTRNMQNSWMQCITNKYHQTTEQTQETCIILKQFQNIEWQLVLSKKNIWSKFCI